MSAPRSEFVPQWLVLSIDVCRGLGISPLRTNSWLSFSQAVLGPRSAQDFFSGGGLKSLKLFFPRLVLIASGAEIFWRVSLKFELFLATSRFHCHLSNGSLYSIILAYTKPDIYPRFCQEPR